MKSNTVILEDELVETLRTKDGAWNIALALAEIATQFPGGSERMYAIRKLHEMNPRLRIDTYDGRKYLHGDFIKKTDVWVPIPKMKDRSHYLKLFEEYS